MDKPTICPCCGQHHFKEPDYYETCPVCHWQDDLLQRLEPDFAGGANDLSLNDYKAEWEKKKSAQTDKVAV